MASFVRRRTISAIAVAAVTSMVMAPIITTATVSSLSASAFVLSDSSTTRKSYSRSTIIVHGSAVPSISSEEVRSRNLHQLERLRERDRHSAEVKREDLKIIFEDDHIVCVDKPSGVLCVPSEEGIPTMAKAVFDYVSHKQSSLDKMVVHRLGMDTSGLVVFAKTMEALRGLNTLFRTRQITRVYEVLVCGHVSKDAGTIDLPLMRDYEHPPFMRVSTDHHQQALLGLDPAIVGKKLLEPPKPSQTRYEVISRETLLDTDLPVSRLLLTSVTGRTHQLNVHCAAIGHPIVGDKVYGLNGDAAPNGGLEPQSSPGEMGTSTLELQRDIASCFDKRNMCAHAQKLSFQHPVFNSPLTFESKAPF
ncbi:pseudouridine synthase [Nitzschia inconspicua]|uniref:Pseudouridine synthase n=1 Tax=Nitzschia inconspicua TaxID=303405 RepID=A0A9K3M6S1_9STRA|nr:pseudouridine synthase [Nitzschia inconspicua]